MLQNKINALFKYLVKWLYHRLERTIDVDYQVMRELPQLVLALHMERKDKTFKVLANEQILAIVFFVRSWTRKILFV